MGLSAFERVWDDSTSWEQARSAMAELARSLEARHSRLAEWPEVEGEELPVTVA